MRYKDKPFSKPVRLYYEVLLNVWHILWSESKLKSLNQRSWYICADSSWEFLRPGKLCWHCHLLLSLGHQLLEWTVWHVAKRLLAFAFFLKRLLSCLYIKHEPRAGDNYLSLAPGKGTGTGRNSYPGSVQKKKKKSVPTSTSEAQLTPFMQFAKSVQQMEIICDSVVHFLIPLIDFILNRLYERFQLNGMIVSSKYVRQILN